MSERLHKLLAQHGLGSRREVEKWIVAGRVQLNGRPAQPGDHFREGDRVTVDGRDVTSRIRITGKVEVLAYHKPQGQPVTPVAPGSDEPASTEETVLERLPAVRGSRWLVINTMQPGDSGLLLLTSDGRLADALRRRSEHIPSAYVARVLVPSPEFDVSAIRHMVQFNDQPVVFDSIEPAGGEGTNRWFLVTAAHAHRRAAVRALLETQGLKVSRVMQVRFADIELPRELPRGRHHVLSAEQVAHLYKVAELEQPAPPIPQREVKAAARALASGKKPRTGQRRSGSNRPSRPAVPADREEPAQSRNAPRRDDGLSDRPPPRRRAGPPRDSGAPAPKPGGPKGPMGGRRGTGTRSSGR